SHIDIDFPHGQETEHNVLDFAKFSQAFGGWGERVTDPDQIRPAFERALKSGKPAIVEVIVERDADASMGLALDAIGELETADIKEPVGAWSCRASGRPRPTRWSTRSTS